MNLPDQVAWQLFIQANSPTGASNVSFETWASDTDTFSINPQFPTKPSPLVPHAPIVPSLGFQAIRVGGGRLPLIPPNPVIGEEARRNKSAFDFIVNNNP